MTEVHCTPTELIASAAGLAGARGAAPNPKSDLITSPSDALHKHRFSDRSRAKAVRSNFSLPCRTRTPSFGGLDASFYPLHLRAFFGCDIPAFAAPPARISQVGTVRG